MSAPKVWLITGASSGFGLAMTETALKKGDKVVATLRKPEVLAELESRYSKEQLLVIKLDVTKPEEIEATFTKAKEAFGRIDIVFNNAGLFVVAEIEGTDDKTARNLFEVMFFGAANVSRTAMKFFRENTPIGGHLIQLSSIVGINGAPGAGYYSATKHAIEGFTESLAGEIDPAWNIKITLLEPGPFRTKGVKENATVLPKHPAYTTDSTKAFRDIVENDVDGDAEKAILAIWKLTRLDDIPFRLPLHRASIATARGKAQAWNEAADKWESWSEDLYH